MELFEVDKNADFKDFYKYVHFELVNKTNHAIPTIFRTKIQNMAIAHLGLKDIFQLRDKYEGQAYMNNLLLKLSALYILEKILLVNLIDWDNSKTHKKASSQIIAYRDKTYVVIPFIYGSLPIVSSEITIPIIFCGIRNDFKTGIFYGVLENYNFDDEAIFISNSLPSKRNLKKFIGFKELKDISE